MHKGGHAVMMQHDQTCGRLRTAMHHHPTFRLALPIPHSTPLPAAPAGRLRLDPRYLLTGVMRMSSSWAAAAEVEVGAVLLG
jgi:hypothetical protein